MDYKHQTPSVIAQLMGLDEDHPQHHVRGKKRVLSEKYLQKVASIGVRVKRSFHEYQSFGKNIEEKEETEDVLKVVKTIRDNHHNLSMVNGKENPHFPEMQTRGAGKELCDAEYASVNKKPEILMASIRPFYIETSSKVLEAPNRGAVFVPSVNAGNPRTKTKNGIIHPHWFLRHDASINWARKISKGQNFRQKDCSEHIKPKPKSKTSLPFLPYLSSNHKEEKCIGLHELKEKNGNDLSDQKSILPQSTRSEILSDFKDSQIMPEIHLIKDKVKNHKLEDSNMSKKISPPYSTIDGVVTDTKTEFVGKPYGNPKEERSEAVACVLLGGDRDSSSHNSYTSVQQGTSEFHEEDSVRSICSGAYSDSHVSFEDVFEPSPISVLEPPFQEDLSSSYEIMETVGSDISYTSECSKILGSDICDPSELDNDGHDLNVSSDGDPEEGSISDFERKQDLAGFFRVEESRDYSYVVEVLTEAGFFNRSLHADFSAWHSLQCPISPSVFEILEKKFGEQPLWKRSDRKLLFDCINLGLLEILNPCMCIPMWEKPVLRRLIAEPRQDIIEEELWALLVSQEKGAKKVSADKMLGGEIRWVELSEDIEVIVMEIVKFLMDELAKEIVCLESF